MRKLMFIVAALATLGGSAVAPAEAEMVRHPVHGIVVRHPPSTGFTGLSTIAFASLGKCSAASVIAFVGAGSPERPSRGCGSLPRSSSAEGGADALRTTRLGWCRPVA